MWRDWFYLPKQDLRAIILLSVLIVIAVAVRISSPLWERPDCGPMLSPDSVVALLASRDTTPIVISDSGITMYYWNAEDYNAASVLTTSNATGSIKMSGSGTGEYRADITGIAAKDLDKVVYVAFVYSDGTETYCTGILGYSIGAYCSSQASKGGDIANLAMATAVYGYHAKAYFG